MVRKGIALDRVSYIHTPNRQLLARIDSLYESVAAGNGAWFVSALDVFCGQDECLAAAKLDDRYQPVAWDYGHLTEVGSLVFAQKALPAIVAHARRLRRAGN